MGHKEQRKEEGLPRRDLAGMLRQSNEYYYWNTATDEVCSLYSSLFSASLLSKHLLMFLKVTWEMPAEYQQQQQQSQAQQTTTQPNSETKDATQKEILETPNETKEITATQKESTKESNVQQQELREMQKRKYKHNRLQSRQRWRLANHILLKTSRSLFRFFFSSSFSSSLLLSACM